MLPRNSSGEMAPLLWWLDENTGRWRQMGEMLPTNNPRTKRDTGGRRFYISDIQTDKISVTNIDIAWKRCYIRAQANAMTVNGVMEPADGVMFTLIGRESSDQDQYYGYTKGVTNKNGIACIPAWCDSNVILQSSMESSNFAFRNGSFSVIHLTPDKTTLDKLSAVLEASVLQGKGPSSFAFIAKVASQTGPIFRNDEVRNCHDPKNNLVAFAYFFKKKSDEVDEVDDFGSRLPGQPLAWYTTDAAKPNQEVNKCFVKISLAVERDLPQPMVSVQSFTPNHHVRYGFSIKRPRVTEGIISSYRLDIPYDVWYWESFACVEYRCSEIGQETFIVVSFLDYRCFSLHLISNQLKKEVCSTLTTGFYAPVDVSDGKLGLYAGPGKIAKERCQAGDMQQQQALFA